MTASDDAVAAIDAALEAWESGPDAYRWEPDAEPGVQRGSRVADWVRLHLGMALTEWQIRLLEQIDAEGMPRPPTFARLRNQPVLHVGQGSTGHIRLPDEQNARSGVGNSSRVPESTDTPEGPQNGTQGRTRAFQRPREGA